MFVRQSPYGYWEAIVLDDLTEVEMIHARGSREMIEAVAEDHKTGGQRAIRAYVERERAKYACQNVRTCL